MSWYSDGEPFDEYDPPYCERCRRTDVSYEVCKRCVRTHNEQDEEDEEEEEDGDEDMAKTMMLLPETVEEFMEQYKIVDTEQIYTNGAELVPIFRMKQWFISHPCEPPRWIPVTERLPEEDKEVLISYRYKEGEGDTSHSEIDITSYGQMYFGGNKVGNNKHWRAPFEYFHSNYEVIAWMPLPEPYKAESEDKE